MIKKKQRGNGALDLADSSFGSYPAEYSVEDELQSGALVKVTAWVTPEMGFGPQRVRVNAAISAQLWKTIVSVPAFCQSWQTVRGRGNEVMWIAAWALQLARRRGEELARFQVFLPTCGDDDRPYKALRIRTCCQDGRIWVVIGLSEEFTAPC